MLRNAKLSLLIGAMAIFAIACDGGDKGDAGKAVELKDNSDSLSYSIGLTIANNMKQDELDVDADVIAEAIKDGMLKEEEDYLMTMEDAEAAIRAFQMEAQQRQQEEQMMEGERNKEEGKVFLQENKDKEGVKVTESGLQYKVIEEGSGAQPTAESNVKVHYTGKLVDGTVFDSSVERGEPASFQVNGVIQGWTEALQLMKEGAKYELYIPSELAYGERGAGGDIGPNSTLIFEVELLEVTD